MTRNQKLKNFYQELKVPSALLVRLVVHLVEAAHQLQEMPLVQAVAHIQVVDHIRVAVHIQAELLRWVIANVHVRNCP